MPGRRGSGGRSVRPATSRPTVVIASVINLGGRGGGGPGAGGGGGGRCTFCSATTAVIIAGTARSRITRWAPGHYGQRARFIQYVSLPPRPNVCQSPPNGDGPKGFCLVDRRCPHGHRPAPKGRTQRQRACISCRRQPGSLPRCALRAPLRPSCTRQVFWSSPAICHETSRYES